MGGVLMTALAIAIGIAGASWAGRIIDWFLDMIAGLANDAANARMGLPNQQTQIMMNQGDAPLSSRPLGPQVQA